MPTEPYDTLRINAENAELLSKAADLRNAAALGRTDVVEELLKTHPRVVNMTDGEGRTAAMLAAANGHAWTIVSLAREGANLHRRDHHGGTAWTMAGNYELVKNALFSLGANPQHAVPSLEPGQRSASADPGHWSSILNRASAGPRNPPDGHLPAGMRSLLVP